MTHNVMVPSLTSALFGGPFLHHRGQKGIRGDISDRGLGTEQGRPRGQVPVQLREDLRNGGLVTTGEAPLEARDCRQPLFDIGMFGGGKFGLREDLGARLQEVGLRGIRRDGSGVGPVEEGEEGCLGG